MYYRQRIRNHQPYLDHLEFTFHVTHSITKTITVIGYLLQECNSYEPFLNILRAQKI